MESIFEKADFTAGSDHKERLRKVLFADTDSDTGTAFTEELRDEELDKAAGGYHAGYSSRTSQKFW